MKFLIIGDLHGKKPKIYRKQFDAIIAPGDFCSDETVKYWHQWFKEVKKNPNAPPNIVEKAGGKRKYKKELLLSKRNGRDVLKYLTSFKKPIYLVPGNWDMTPWKESDWSFFRKDHWSDIKKGLTGIHDLHLKKKTTKEFCFTGHGITHGPEKPPQTKTRKMSKKRYKEIEKEYKKKLTKIDNLCKRATKPIIFLTHNVPYNTKIDLITNKKSDLYGKHWGSMLAKDIVKKHQPLVCIGGHMHEHHTATRVGKTVCINAGFGPNVNTFLEIENNKIKELTFIRNGKVTGRWNGRTVKPSQHARGQLKP